MMLVMLPLSAPTPSPTPVPACPEVPYVNGSACDWQCYLDRYPDLGATFGADNIEAASTHYRCIGHAEGRDCTCGQSESLAVHLNPSLITSHIARSHFVSHSVLLSQCAFSHPVAVQDTLR